MFNFFKKKVEYDNTKYIWHIHYPDGQIEHCAGYIWLSNLHAERHLLFSALRREQGGE